MLRKPIRAKCGDRNTIAKRNSIYGEPDEWLRLDVLKEYNLGGISFCFFVNWSKNTISKEIWEKRIVKDDITWPINNFNINRDAIKKLDTKEYTTLLYKFCTTNEFSGHYMLFKDLDNWRDDLEEIVDIDITELTCNVVSPKTLSDRIAVLRGISVPIGKGGLIYSDSTLECYFAQKQWFWPGDVDLVLLDEKSMPIALIEFKKHNLDSDIKDENIEKYIKTDKLKYQSLGLLRDCFDNRPPVIVIQYPTKPGKNKIKIDKLDGPFDELESVQNKVIDIPKSSDVDTCKDLVENILEMVFEGNGLIRSNFVEGFYSGFDDDFKVRSIGALEQLADDMALNRYLTGCRESIDRNSFILIYNGDLYQVIFIDEDTIIVQMVEEKNDNKYELIKSTLRVMNLEEYGEFVQETEY